jgi:hypothetical protein
MYNMIISADNEKSKGTLNSRLQVGYLVCLNHLALIGPKCVQVSRLNVLGINHSIILVGK